MISINTLKKIIKNLAICLLFLLVGYILFTLLFVVIVQPRQTCSQAFLCVVNSTLPVGADKNIITNVLLLSIRMLDSIIIAVMSSTIFLHIINHDVEMVFPKKLILRKRTSEGVNDKLTLGVLIGNKNRNMLSNVKCSLICRYSKGELEGSCKEEFNEYVACLENYQRFSFYVQDFPKTFWRGYLHKDDDSIKNNYITVIVSGSTNNLGGQFRAIKKYTLQDIVIDSHNPEKYFLISKGNKLTNKIDWDKIKKLPFFQPFMNKLTNIIDWDKIKKLPFLLPFMNKRTNKIDWDKFTNYREDGEPARMLIIKQLTELTSDIEEDEKQGISKK